MERLAKVFEFLGTLAIIWLGLQMTLNNRKITKAHLESSKAFNSVMGWKSGENDLRQYTAIRILILIIGIVFVFSGLLALFKYLMVALG